MNLDGLLEDRSLTNLDWLNNPETYVPQDKDINKKDDLGLEWGGFTINDSPVPTTISDEMDLEGTAQNVNTLLESAYILMHQGIMGKYLIRQLRSNFIPEVIDAAMPSLRNLVKNEGIVGCALIDIRDSRIANKLIAAANKSPYKRHINYVLMGSEQLDNTNLVEKRVISSSSIKNGSIDGFFDGDENSKAVEYYYKPLGLKIIALNQTPVDNSAELDSQGGGTPQRREDLDNEWYDKTLIELASLGDLEEEDVAEIKASDLSKINKIRKAFRKAYSNMKSRAAIAGNESKTAPNKASDYSMESSIMEVNVAQNTAKPDIEDIDMHVAAVELEASKEVEFGNMEWTDSALSEFNVQDKQASDLEIDSNQFLGHEYDGCEIVELDGIKSAKDELDVDISGGFSF